MGLGVRLRGWLGLSSEYTLSDTVYLGFGGFLMGANFGLITSYFEGGYLEKDNSMSMYKYELLDPLDKPYVTFRYVYKSWSK